MVVPMPLWMAAETKSRPVPSFWFLFGARTLAPEKESSSSSQNSPDPRDLLYILFSALAFLSGWSLAKFRALNTDVSKTVPAQDGTREETYRRCVEPPAVSQVAPPQIQTYQTNKVEDDTPRRKKIVEWSIPAANIGLLIVNIFLLGATNKAASAAKDSVDLAGKNAQMDQRAWVAVSDISSDSRQSENWTVSLIFKNTGKTPAKNFVIWGTGEPVAKGQKPTSEEIKLPGRGVIAPDGSFHSNLNVNGGYDWKSIDLVIHGRINYDSVFRPGHWTKFCYYFVPDNKTGKGGFAPCDSGNDIDNNPP
jgi:hypothetical protein